MRACLSLDGAFSSRAQRSIRARLMAASLVSQQEVAEAAARDSARRAAAVDAQLTRQVRRTH